MYLVEKNIVRLNPNHPCSVISLEWNDYLCDNFLKKLVRIHRVGHDWNDLAAAAAAAAATMPHEILKGCFFPSNRDR